jgi:hypothetical protein
LGFTVRALLYAACCLSFTLPLLVQWLDTRV